jgi:hypothetical protein
MAFPTKLLRWDMNNRYVAHIAEVINASSDREACQNAATSTIIG